MFPRREVARSSRLGRIIVVGSGAHGEIAHRVQRALVDAQLMDAVEVDSWYGSGTAAAVRRFQNANALTASGNVDDFTWKKLLPTAPLPMLAERCLALTAAFEGHDYTLAVGDFDG